MRLLLTAILALGRIGLGWVRVCVDGVGSTKMTSVQLWQAYTFRTILEQQHRPYLSAQSIG